MLHAVIRSGQGAVHVIGDISEYNLETLVEHARYSLAHGDTVSMKVEVDASERELFLTRSQRWMQRLARSGVEVDVISTPRAPAHRALASARHPQRAVGH
jgi:hypothetical protein